MSNWGSEINLWTERLIKAWESGDMARFRELAKGIDGVWSDKAMDLHAEELYGALADAVAGGIDATLQTMSASDFGLEFIQGRKEVAATLDSAEWSKVPYQLRERAFFSSKVNDIKTLQEVKTRVEAALTWKPGDTSAPVMDSGLFAKEMRGILINGGVRTADATELGTLKDIMSTQRMKLVFDTQTAMARGWSEMKTGMDPDLLDAFPGYHFTRLMPKRNPRPGGYWDAQWSQAVAAARGVGCILSPKMGLKTSPVWQALGNLGPFGNPFAPFAYGSGMGLEDADRYTCESVGLLKKDEVIEPMKVPDLTDRMEEGISGIGADLISRIKGFFGDQVKIDGDKAVWAG